VQVTWQYSPASDAHRPPGQSEVSAQAVPSFVPPVHVPTHGRTMARMHLFNSTSMTSQLGMALTMHICALAHEVENLS
jgi:hypothetical protein